MYVCLPFDRNDQLLTKDREMKSYFYCVPDMAAEDNTTQ